jgi:magnesium transporter
MEPGRTRAAGKLKIGGNWKPNTESLHIRFDSLEQLLVSEEAAQDIEAELPRPTDHDYTRKNPTTACEPRRPQRFALYSSSSGSILEGTSFIELGLAGQDLRHFFSQGRKNAWWLDVQNPSEKTVRQLSSAFGIHHLTVEDIVTGECGEKIEGFPFYYFTCVRSFHVVQTGSHFEYEPYNIYVVVFDEGALSFTFTQSEHSTHVRDRIELLKDYLSISSDWIFYALLLVFPTLE